MPPAWQRHRASVGRCDLAAAIKQIRTAGKFDLLFAWCKATDRPTAIVDLVAESLKTVGELEAVVALYDGQDPETLDVKYDLD